MLKPWKSKNDDSLEFLETLLQRGVRIIFLAVIILLGSSLLSSLTSFSNFEAVLISMGFWILFLLHNLSQDVHFLKTLAQWDQLEHEGWLHHMLDEDSKKASSTKPNNTEPSQGKIIPMKKPKHPRNTHPTPPSDDFPPQAG